MTKKEIIDVINSVAPVLSIGTVTGNTFAHEQGKIQQWEITANDTLTITGLSAGVPAVGLVQMTQGTGGGYLPTLPGNSDDVVYRLNEGDVNILGYLWDGTSIRWDSSYKVTVEYPTGYETESIAFFSVNTGLTDGEKTAVNNLVIAMKAIGWSKFNAVYPMIGGSAATHKWNLINPVDSDAAFRLTFTGGWTHDANGALPNGTDGYANTHFEISGNTPPDPPATNLADTTSFHVGFYNRTATAPGASDYFLFGVQRSSLSIGWDVYNTDRFSIGMGEAADTITVTGVANFDRLCLISRTANNSAKAFRDAAQVGTTVTNTYSEIISVSTPMFISALNSAGTAALFGYQQCAFFSIGAGLSDAEVTAFNTAINDFQTALSRNV